MKRQFGLFATGVFVGALAIDTQFKFGLHLLVFEVHGGTDTALGFIGQLVEITHFKIA